MTLNFASDKFFQLFIRYFSLSIVFLLLFSVWGECCYYNYFNINIINICSVQELLFTQRGILNSEKLAAAMTTPIVIVLVHILYCWMSETLGHKICHIIIFSCLIVLSGSIISPIFQSVLSLLPILILVLNLLFLWLVLFQANRFQRKGIRVHIFITMCLFIAMAGFKRIQKDFFRHLNHPSNNINSVSLPENVLQNNHWFLVGSTENMNIFYDDLTHRGYIFPKPRKQK